MLPARHHYSNPVCTVLALTLAPLPVALFVLRILGVPLP